jgi:hypothetical protein
MGRRPIGNRAMTRAEAQRRYMARREARAKAEGVAEATAKAEAKPSPKGGGATNAEARALDAAIARLEAEVPSVPMLPQPGQWCAALSAAGLEAIVLHLAALRVRIGELERLR